MNDHSTAGRTVGELMTRNPICISADAPLTEAAHLLGEHHIHGLPVVDADGALVGVVSQTDMMRARITQDLWANWPGLRVRHLMTAPALTIDADADVADAAHRMEAEHVHRLVVLAPDGRTPAAIISTSDLVRAMVREVKP